MLERTLISAAIIACGLAGVAHAHQQPSPVQPAPVKRTILQRADVPGTNLEIIYATVEIAAGVKAGRHSHPGTVIAQSNRRRVLDPLRRPVRKDRARRRVAHGVLTAPSTTKARPRTAGEAQRRLRS